MRLRLLCLFCLSGLSGCVYYGDIHGDSQALTASSLNTSHTYYIPGWNFKKTNWWNRLQDPQLNQLITVALSDSPTMHIAEARVRRAQHLAEGAVSPLWPNVDFSGYLQRARFPYEGLIPPPFNGGTFDIGDVGLNLNYEFDLWGKNREALAASVSERCATIADLAQSRLLISAAVAQAYFQLLNNIGQLALAKKYLHQSQEIKEIVVDLATHGINSDIPVKNAIGDVQTAKLSVEQFQAAEKLSRNQLAVLMGKNPFETEIYTRRFAFHKHPVSLPEPLTANLLAGRPDINAAKLRAEAAAHQIKVAKAGFFPDINLTGLFSYQSIKLGQLFDVRNQSNSIMGAIDLPIFDAGLRRANLGTKYAEYDIAVNEYNQSILNALHEVSDQKAKLESLAQQIKSQNIALQATKNNLRLFNSQYSHGIIAFVPVLEIKQLLYQQEATELNLQTQQLQAVVAMLKALGGVEG